MGFLDDYEVEPAPKKSFLDDYEVEAPAPEPTAKASFLDDYETEAPAPEQDFGFMRNWALPFLGGAATTGIGTGLGMAVGALTGPLAPLAVPVLGGIGGGLSGGMGFRGTREALTDQEWGEVVNPGEMGFDAIVGGALGAGGFVLKSFLKSGAKAVPGTINLKKDAPIAGARAVSERLVNASDEMYQLRHQALDLPGPPAPRTPFADAVKQRTVANDLWRDGLIDDDKYTSWMRNVDDELEAIRPQLEDGISYGRTGDLDIGTLRHHASIPDKQLQRWGDEALANADPSVRAQGEYVRAFGDAMEQQALFARRAEQLNLARGAEIGKKLSPWGRTHFEEMASGKFTGPLRQGDAEAVHLWSTLMDEAAELSEDVGLLTARKGSGVLPFKPVENYVPEFTKGAEAGSKLRRLIGGSKGIVEHARRPGQIPGKFIVQDYDEILRRWAKRDAERVANSAIFGGLSPASERLAKGVGGESGMSGLAMEGLALLREVGKDDAADMIATFLKATHGVGGAPEKVAASRLQGMAGSALLNRNVFTQSSEIGKAVAFFGRPTAAVRGRHLLETRFPHLMPKIGSTISDVGEAMGSQHGRWYDPKTTSFGMDRMTRRFGAYGAADMVNRVSHEAAQAVKKGGKFGGALLREASEIASEHGSPEDAVRYLARRWTANGNEVAEDVLRDGIDKLVGRVYYNFDPASTPNMLRSPLGQVTLAYRFYLARAGRHFRDDVLQPLLRPRDASEFLLGTRRLFYATGGALSASALQRAIRTWADQGADKAQDTDYLVQRTLRDTAGTVAGTPGEFAAMALSEALHQADRYGAIDADDAPWNWLGAERGAFKDLERWSELFPAGQVAVGAAGDVASGDQDRVLKGLMTSAQAAGGLTDDPRFAWLRALGHVPRATLKSDD